jgi:3-hydroxyacyl-[acyl-carrier-protein] dehydratase
MGTNMTPEETRQQALNFLPHGTEFRFIDRLLTLDPGKAGEAEYLVRGDEAFLPGHFPGDPIFPGVLLAEAVAQLAGVVAQSDPTIPPLKGLRLTALRNIKILGTARPGQTILLKASIAGRMGHLIQARVTASVAGEMVLTGEITLSGGK